MAKRRKSGMPRVQHLVVHHVHRIVPPPGAFARPVMRPVVRPLGPLGPPVLAIRGPEGASRPTRSVLWRCA
jgi:hypothetical protein